MVNQKLKELEHSTQHLFHGSPFRIDGPLLPRQPLIWKNKQPIPDGKPAVCATPYLDYAIFMAIIGSHNCPKGHHISCGLDHNGPEFKATKATIDQLTPDSSGYVYVFNKIDFLERNPMEWRTEHAIVPVSVMQVFWRDFAGKLTVNE